MPKRKSISDSTEMLGGTSRQMDNVITLKDSSDPIALLESKWLKDARHHNDKGAWILQLREVRKKHSTVRGAAAILAGYWTEGVGLMFKTEGGVEMVLVAKDDEIYPSLQEPVNEYMRAHQLGEFTFDVRAIRNRLPRPDDLARCASSQGYWTVGFYCLNLTTVPANRLTDWWRSDCSRD